MLEGMRRHVDYADSDAQMPWRIMKRGVINEALGINMSIALVFWFIPLLDECVKQSPAR